MIQGSAMQAASVCSFCLNFVAISLGLSVAHADCPCETARTATVSGDGTFALAARTSSMKPGAFGLPPRWPYLRTAVRIAQTAQLQPTLRTMEISKGSASQGLQFLNYSADQAGSSLRLSPPSADASPSDFHSHSHSNLPLHSQANASRRVAYEPELSCAPGERVCASG